MTLFNIDRIAPAFVLFLGLVASLGTAGLV